MFIYGLTQHLALIDTVASSYFYYFKNLVYLGSEGV